MEPRIQYAKTVGCTAASLAVPQPGIVHSAIATYEWNPIHGR
jgi:hypothetical protein